MEREGTITRQKARKLGFTEAQASVEKAHGFKLQDAVLLSECISAAATCSSCKSPSSQLQLFQDNSKRDGLAEHLFLKCSHCNTEVALETSQKLGGKSGGASEVNRRAVIATQRLGRSGLEKLCSTMNLPPPVNKSAYNRHMKNVNIGSVAVAERLMTDAAKRLTNLIQEEEPSEIETDDEGNVIACVPVTVDGTWQKCRHSSKNGVVFVVSVHTGEILDYAVKTLNCPECTAHEKWNITTSEYTNWKQNHVCQINHTGSSEEMEAQGAIEIFSRSIETRGLKYTAFVGDGDSSCFGKVQSAMKDKYGDKYLVTKEECVGHIQKRLGAAIKKYKNSKKGLKLADGKGVGGRNRLTDAVCDSMQNFYGEAIRNNQGDLKGMVNDIWAIPHHMVVDPNTPLNEQHRFCPKHENTWCKYWSKNKEYDQTNRLPEVFMEELKPIFTRLSDEKLLKRCLKGLTQNQNESANGQLWSRCPKTVHCGRKKVTIAVCETVCVFNTGAASKAIILEECGVKQPGKNMLRALKKEDTLRLKLAAQKTSRKYRMKRRILRAQKKKKKDKQSYKSGSFGLSEKPEKVKGTKRKADSSKKLKESKTKSTAKNTAKKQKLSSTAKIGETVTTFAEPEVEVIYENRKALKKGENNSFS